MYHAFKQFEATFALMYVNVNKLNGHILWLYCNICAICDKNLFGKMDFRIDLQLDKKYR